MAEPLRIEARHLGRKYRDRWGVRGIDLAVVPGEMLGVVGPDGAGKTTLLQMCAAILDPSEGSCAVLGLDTVRQSKAVGSRIGYMSQGFTLYDRLSVEENLRFAAEVRAVTGVDYTTRRAELMSMAGLEGFADWPAARLSGGMRKKLSLCTNLVHRPPVLILDEPALGVDPLSRRQLWAMLDGFRRRGTSMLIATSYMDEAARCDRILLLHQGRALTADRPDAVRARAAGRVLEAISADPTVTARALQKDPRFFGVQVLPGRVRFLTADSLRVPATDIPGAGPARPVPPSLEDVFVLRAGIGDERSSETEMLEVSVSGGIEAKNVTVRFGEFIAVDSVSLAAEPGEVLALLGPNGAGKTTLIRALCGLVPISVGSLKVADHPVQFGASKIRERIGYMSQRFSLYPDLSMGENLRFFASAYGLRGRAADTAIAWASAVAGLEIRERGSVSTLSGATRQRLALACSILHRPAVLFLDEPTSGIDPLSRYRFWRLIRALAERGMTIVVSTHYLDEAEYCDRIALMHHGRLILEGPLAELRQKLGADSTTSVETLFVTAIARDEEKAT